MTGREQPVLAANHEWTNGIFGGIVVNGIMAVIHITDQMRPLVVKIEQRFAKQGLRWHVRYTFFEPAFDFIEHSLCVLLPCC